MIENQTKMDLIKQSFATFCTLCDPTLLDVLRERVEDQSQEWQRIEGRLQAKVADIKVCSFHTLIS